MKAVMSHQSITSIGRETLIYDGNVEEYVGKDYQKELVSFLKPNSKMKLRRVPSAIFGISKNAQFFEDGNTLLVISNFLSTDEKGRKVSYSFYCDTADKVLYTCRLLQDYAALANMKLDPSDIKVITYILSTSKRVKYLLIILSIIIIVLLIIIK